MIHVNVQRNTTRQITFFSVEGHAGFAEAGQDIVCAAVSAVTFGTVNALEKLLSVQLVAESDERGVLRCQVPFIPDPETKARAQLLLEAMLSALEDISAEYGEFVQIHDDHGGEKPC